jgi:hypothetical protein
MVTPAPAPVASPTPQVVAAPPTIREPTAPVAATATVEMPVRRGANDLQLGARAGVSFLAQRLVSDGSRPLSSYDVATAAPAVVATAAWLRHLGRARLGLDLAYRWAGAAGVRYTAPGVDVTLAVSSHTVDAAVVAGVRLGGERGVDLALRAGGHLSVDILVPDAALQLPSARVLGVAAGLVLDAPEPFAVSGHPVGLHLQATAIVPALTTQTRGLEDGTSARTWGVVASGELRVGLRRGRGGALLLALGYGYRLLRTRSEGTSPRDPTIAHADRGVLEQIATGGLLWSF